MSAFKKGIIYGVTHDVSTGKAMIRVPRSIKVGIGLPKGPAIHVYIDANKKWVVSVGTKDAKITRFDSKSDAIKNYREAVKKAPDRPYPSKLPYFIFTRIGPDGIFHPDFDMTEAAGPLPTELSIVFTSDDPLTSSYEMWSASALQCEGDGINARRILKLAQGDEQQRLATEAANTGQKYFPIENGCREMGCPFAQAQGDKAPLCKPHASLRFQLRDYPNLGSEATFDTTSYRSTSWLSSSLEQLRAFAGGNIAGAGVKLKLAPFRVTHAGKGSTAFAVWLDVSGKDVTEMRKLMWMNARSFAAATPAPGQKALNPPTFDATAETVGEDEDDFLTEAQRAKALTDEFYQDGPDDAVFDQREPVQEIAEPERMQPSTEDYPDDADSGAAASEDPPEPPNAPVEPPKPAEPLIGKNECIVIVSLAKTRGLEGEALALHLKGNHQLSGGVANIPASKYEEVCGALKSMAQVKK